MKRKITMDSEKITDYRKVTSDCKGILNPVRWDDCNFGRNIHDHIVNDTAKSLGLGYTEWGGESNMAHNPNLFTENGFAINPALKYYIKDFLYLKPHIFDYNRIKYEFRNV